MRSFLAILLGYLIFAIPSAVLFWVAGVDPHQESGIGFMAGSIFYGIFFAIAGGYMAARIAQRKEIVIACVVASVLAVLAAISIVAQPGLPTYWSQIAAIVSMAPAAVLGGWLRAIQTKAANKTL
jgi:hypothetical protein